MQATTQANATNHYRNNISHYNSVRARLSAARQRFRESDRSGKVRMLQKSYTFAAISVHTPVANHERSFIRLWADGFPDSKAFVTNALREANYRINKADYIWETLNSDVWEPIVDYLESGQIDKAQRYILDNCKGVGTVKAPFTLSMIGFTQKMCIDRNISNLVEIDVPTTVVVSRYEDICQNLRETFPTLSEMVPPFLFQWILFDYKRGENSLHDAFYEEVGVC